MNKRQRKKERKKRAAAAWFSMMDGMSQFLGTAESRFRMARITTRKAAKAFDDFAARVYLSCATETIQKEQGEQ